MKHKSLIILAIAAVATTFAAQSQVRFGVKAGITLNKLRFSDNALEEVIQQYIESWSDNCTGFTGGVMIDAELPLTGLCVDGSIMYVHRRKDMDYINVPINIKYKFAFPGAEQKFCPFIATGPDIAFRVNKDIKEIAEIFKQKRFDIAWNIGLGFEIVRHIQLQASYGFGLNKIVYPAEYQEGAGLKNRYWTITAAFLF